MRGWCAWYHAGCDVSVVIPLTLNAVMTNRIGADWLGQQEGQDLLFLGRSRVAIAQSQRDLESARMRVMIAHMRKSWSGKITNHHPLIAKLPPNPVKTVSIRWRSRTLPSAFTRRLRVSVGWTAKRSFTLDQSKGPVRVTSSDSNQLPLLTLLIFICVRM